MSENYGFNIGYDFNEDQRLTYKFTRANYDWEYKDPESYIRKGDTVIWPGKDIDDSKYASFYGTRGWRAYNMHSLTYNDQKNKIHAHIGMTDYFKDGYTQPGYTKGTLDGNLNGSGDKYSYPSKSIDFDLNKRWAFGNHNLLAGTSYGRDKFDETIYSIKDWKSWSSSGSVTQKAGGKDKYWSLYAQDKWNFAPKWTAYIGGRYDHYEDYDGYDTLLSGDNDKGSHSYHKFSPKLSLDYAVNPDTNVYLSYGKSFNTPILYQLFRYSTRMGLIYPNSGLTPETTDTWELGLKKKIANKTDIHADVFYAKTEDYIRLMSYEGGQGKGKRYENNGDEKTHGFEVSLTQRHSNIWTSYINYTWQTAKNNGYKDYNVPRHLLHLGTTYNKAPWTINLDGMFISNRYLDITPGDTKKYDYHSGHFRSRDAYFLMNLSTNYQFNKNFGIQFAVNNLFDREYYDEDISNNHYYIGDGRTYTLTARYSF